MTARTRSRSPTSPRSVSCNARSPTAARCSPSPAVQRSWGRTDSSRLSDRARSEPKPRVAVLTFGEGVGRHRGNLEHPGFTGTVVERAVAHLEAPLAAVLRHICVGDALQLDVVAHLHRVLEPLPRLRPRGCGDAVVAVPGIQLGHGIVASHRALLPLRHRVIGIRPHAPAELTDEFGPLCSSYFTDRHK